MNIVPAVLFGHDAQDLLRHGCDSGRIKMIRARVNSRIVARSERLSGYAWRFVQIEPESDLKQSLTDSPVQYNHCPGVAFKGLDTGCKKVVIASTLPMIAGSIW